MADIDDQYHKAPFGDVDFQTLDARYFKGAVATIAGAGLLLVSVLATSVDACVRYSASGAVSTSFVALLPAAHFPHTANAPHAVVASSSAPIPKFDAAFGRTVASASPANSVGFRGAHRSSTVLVTRPEKAAPGFLSQLVNGFRGMLKGSSERGMTVPGWQGRGVWIPFAVRDSLVSQVFQTYQWSAKWPYKESDFSRIDKNDDGYFYGSPRFVTHIDDAAIKVIRSFYARHFDMAPQDDYNVLDICSSWISHYPEQLRAKRVAITGMNKEELEANRQATENVVLDLNRDPNLPFESDQFDFVTNVVSVDYLTKPQEVFREVHRVMKPGGLAIMSFSNRCFATKAIQMWRADMEDGPGHCEIVGNYFQFSPSSGWQNISSVDISPYPGFTDPVWVVTAVKAY